MNIIKKNIYFYHDFNKNFADFIKMTEKSPWQKELNGIIGNKI
jgi:hypothetical protein